MQDHKISNFESENGKGSFPFHSAVPCLEVARVTSILKERLNLDKDSTGEMLVMGGAAKSDLVESVDPEKPKQVVSAVMESFEADLDGWVYLNWGCYEVFA